MFILSKLLGLMVMLILHDKGHAGRIVGGHEAVAHSRPYMVLLKRFMEENSPRFCGGFLLSKDFVMTAAHCQAKSYRALLGLHNSHLNYDQDILVEDAFPHEDYNSSTFMNDIMILRLSSKAELNQRVKTIDLADGDDGSLPASCSISGWGQTDWENSSITNKLREINVSLIQEDCHRHFYCSKDKKGPGQGDSGGPLVCDDGKAFGVVSTMSKPYSNGLRLFRYTKIPDYKDWINRILNKASLKF